MIHTSGDFKTLMESNVRPKCEPIIRVSGKDSQGNDVFLEWKGKDIKNLTYKRSIDVLGREVPSMELTWTEIYTGKLNTQAYPEKYNNIVKYMTVDLLFAQDLTTRASWRDLYSSGVTWKQLFDAKETWRKIRNTPRQEIVPMPKLFLSARPTISGKTITWKATDLISFLTQEQIKAYSDIGSTGMDFQNPLMHAALTARSAFLSVPSIFKAISDSVDEMEKNFVAVPALDRKIISTGAINNFLANYCSLRNLHIDFKDNIFVVKPLIKTAPVYHCSAKVIKEYPAISINPDISAYNYKAYLWTEQTGKKYEKKHINVPSYLEQYDISEYKFDGYGVPQNLILGATEIDYALSWAAEILQIVPIDYSGIEQTLFNNILSGEPLIEDNPVFPYRSNEDGAKNRFEFLKEYFNSKCASLEFEGLPNISLETGDVISVETSLFDEENRLTKNAVIVGLEISYSGAMMQKIKAHEVLL